MKPPKPADKQLDQWLSSIEDGVINAEEHAALMNRLRQDPEARKAYWNHMAFVSAMNQASSIWGLEHEGLNQRRLPPTPSRLMARSVLAAAAIVAFLMVIGALVAARQSPPVRVAATPGSDWSFASGGINPSGDFEPDTRFVVERGTVEIRGREGSEVILEGPSIYEIRSPLHGNLISGVAWCKISPADEGFTILTPRLRVVDLGTEFGVFVSDSQEQVHVGSGQVEVKSRLPQIAGTTLDAGNAVAADAVGRLSPVPFRGDLFQQSLPAKPTIWHWSFDDLEQGLSSDPGGFRVIGAQATLGEGAFGNAVDFSASTTGGLSDFPGVPGSVPRSIAVWVKGAPVPARYGPGGESLASTIVGWGPYSTTGGKWQLATTSDGRGVLTQWGGSWVASNLPEGESLLDGKWHHIASVFTGKHDEKGVPEIHHYVDGVQRALSRLSAIHPVVTSSSASNSLPMMLSTDAWPEVPQAVNPWKIDELFIARHAFNENEIMGLFQNNSPTEEIR